MSSESKDVIYYLRNYKKVAEKVKNIIHKFDPTARIYVFGSVVRGEYTAASDIDILVVTDRLDKKYDMMTEVYHKVDGPIELHVTTEETMQRWYLKFIREDEIEEI